MTPAVVFDLHAWHKLHASPGITFPSPAWCDPSLMAILLDSTAGTQREEGTQTTAWCKNKSHEKYVLGISSPSQRPKCQQMKLKNSWKCRRHFQLGACLVFTQQMSSNTETSTNKFECIISIPEEMQCHLAWGLKLDLLRSRSGAGYPLTVCHRLLNLLFWSSKPGIGWTPPLIYPAPGRVLAARNHLFVQPCLLHLNYTHYFSSKF